MTFALRRLFDWKVRGVRWIDIIGLMLVGAMVFSVYLAKAAAARESGRISDLERQIADNSHRVRLLNAEAARLERPGRLEALSREAGLGPVDVHRQAAEGQLPALAPAEEPAPPAAPRTAPAVEAAPR
jgi:hypothetical protein